MVSLELTIEGIDQMYSHFLQVPIVTQREVSKAIKKALLTLTRYARLNFKYFPIAQLVNKHPHRTGFLMGAGLVSTFTELTGKLEEKAPYGVYVQEGPSRLTSRPFYQQAI